MFALGALDYKDRLFVLLIGVDETRPSDQTAFYLFLNVSWLYRVWGLLGIICSMLCVDTKTGWSISVCVQSQTSFLLYISPSLCTIFYRINKQQQVMGSNNNNFDSYLCIFLICLSLLHYKRVVTLRIYTQRYIMDAVVVFHTGLRSYCRHETTQPKKTTKSCACRRFERRKGTTIKNEVMDTQRRKK